MRSPRVVFALLVGACACATQAPAAPRGWAHVQYERCTAGEDDMCVDLLRSQASFGESFRPKAVEAGQLACDRGRFDACRYLIALEPRAEAKLEARQHLCVRGEARACEEALRDMRGVGADAAAQMPYAFAGCEADATSYVCSYPIRALAKEAWAPTPTQRRKAFELAACGPLRMSGTPFNVPMSCDAKIATVQMGLPDGYKNTFADYPAATALFQLACEAGDMFACGRLGLNEFRGIGTEQNIESGLQRMHQACEAGDRPACYALGLAMLDTADPKNPKNPELASAAFARTCEDHGPCYAWTAAVVAQRGHRKHALVLAEQGCELQASCAIAGRLMILLRERSNPHIPALLESCGTGSERSCRALAYAYRKGYGVKASKKMARLFYNAAEDQTLRAKWWASLERSGTPNSRPIDEANVWVSLLLPYTLPLMAALNPKQNWNFEDEGLGRLPTLPPFPVLPVVYGMPQGPVAPAGDAAP